jgi:hypothetical protein
MEGIEGFVYAFGCLYVAGLMAMGGMLLHASNKLSNIVGDPIMFMLQRGWVQCTCCGCLIQFDRATAVDDYGGSGPGTVCPSCLIGGEKTQLLFMLLGDGDRFYRVLELQQRGELTQGMLELEVFAQLVPGYAPDREG